jgi:YD repeat-containing protein
MLLSCRYGKKVDPFALSEAPQPHPNNLSVIPIGKTSRLEAKGIMGLMNLLIRQGAVETLIPSNTDGSVGASINRDTSGDLGYDTSGNATSVYNGISRAAFTYDADGKMLTANSGSATYTYDANGNRVRKDAGGTWTEYLYFNGQPLAEKNADGTWSDYIYANGQRMARADNYDIRIHLKGTNCSNCGSNPNMFAGVTSLTPN